MLTIGSIVYLKEGSQKLMVLSRGPVVNRNDKLSRFDYAACLYPVGLGIEETFYFNEENVDKVLFEGYRDEDETRFQELYAEWLETEGKLIEKANVTTFNQSVD